MNKNFYSPISKNFDFNDLETVPLEVMLKDFEEHRDEYEKVLETIVKDINSRLH